MKIMAAPLGWLPWMLLHFVHWFAHFPRWSYRIPGPPFWLMLDFFVVAVTLRVAIRAAFAGRRVAILTLE